VIAARVSAAAAMPDASEAPTEETPFVLRPVAAPAPAPEAAPEADEFGSGILDG